MNLLQREREYDAGMIDDVSRLPAPIQLLL